MRPEHFFPAGPGEDCILATIDVVQPTGSRTYGSFALADAHVKVNKGEWDRSRGVDPDHEFHRTWLAACHRILKPAGSIWVSGTSHVYLSVGLAMRQIGFRILNDVVWEKPAPPPNLGCRCFTHATEILLWATKAPKGSRHRHTFNYEAMKAEKRRPADEERLAHPAAGKGRKAVRQASDAETGRARRPLPARDDERRRRGRGPVRRLGIHRRRRPDARTPLRRLRAGRRLRPPRRAPAERRGRVRIKPAAAKVRDVIGASLNSPWQKSDIDTTALLSTLACMVMGTIHDDGSQQSMWERIPGIGN